MRERQREPQMHDARPQGEGGGEADHAGLHQRAADLRDAAASAIDRILSRDSAEFLRQNRQAGGQ